MQMSVGYSYIGIIIRIYVLALEIRINVTTAYKDQHIIRTFDRKHSQFSTRTVRRRTEYNCTWNLCNLCMDSHPLSIASKRHKFPLHSLRQLTCVS